MLRRKMFTSAAACLFCLYWSSRFPRIHAGLDKPLLIELNRFDPKVPVIAKLLIDNKKHAFVLSTIAYGNGLDLRFLDIAEIDTTDAKRSNNTTYYRKGVIQSELGTHTSEPFFSDDFSHLSELWNEKISGVLGLAFLWDYALTFDGVSFFLTDDFSTDAYEEIIPIAMGRVGEPLVEAELPSQKKIKIAISTSSNTYVLLKKELFEQEMELGNISAVSERPTVRIGVEKNVREGILKELKIFGQTHRNMLVHETENLTAVGSSFMSQYVFSLQLQHGRIGIKRIALIFEK